MSGLLNRSIRGAVLVGWAAGLLWWEYKRSLRRVVDSKLKRDVRNMMVAGLAAAATLLLEAPVAIAIARRAQQQHTGLLRVFPSPAWMKQITAVLLLDYTLYIWHILTHRVPVLWRFHRVHHIDREMDASTAFRFHFGEIAISVAFRAAQIQLIGPTPAMYAAWQTFLFFCILFHHANVRLPLVWERRLARLLVTPRLHGIHHSIVPEEMNSNWSSGFTIWDRFHRTLRTRVLQESIVVGVQGFRSDLDQELTRVLIHPFVCPGTPLPGAGTRGSDPVSALEP